MDVAQITQAYRSLAPVFHERFRRLFGAMLAESLGRGGVTRVSQATGLARSTLTRGIQELALIATGEAPGDHIRRAGGGRKKASETDPALVEALQRLVDPA